MKRTLTYLIFIVLFLSISTGLSSARGFWEKQVQPEWQTHFNDVDHGNPYYSTRAWAVGDGGVIARSTDGGLNWSYQNSKTSSDLQSVHFADDETGWAIGILGTIRSTSDGGATWSPEASGVTDTLYGVYALADNDVWAVGQSGAILHYNGSLWQEDSQSGAVTDSTLYGVYFWNSNNGWAAGAYSTILYYDGTQPDGSRWTAQTSDLTTNLDLRDAQFISGPPPAAEGWIVGASGTILHTTDGGSSGWTTQAAGVTDQYLYSVDFYDNVDSGWIAGGQTYDPGILLRTTDGGTNWSYWIPNRQLLGISFANLFPGDGIAVGRYGVIMKTGNGGDTWTQETKTAANLHGFAAQGDKAWACGSMGTVVRYSFNSGTGRWEYVDEPDTGVYNELNAISFPTPAGTPLGWAVGMGRGPWQHITPTPNVTPRTNTVIHTSDGGMSWTYQTLPHPTPGWLVDENMYDVFMLNENKGWICGGYGSVFGTNDGSYWSLLNQQDTDAYDVNNTLFGIHFINSSDGWACGNKGENDESTGLVYHTNNGGADWSLQWSYAGIDLYAIQMLEPQHTPTPVGSAVGTEGTILKTKDGGENWYTVETTSTQPDPLYGIDFYDSMNGMAVGLIGNEGGAYRTAHEGWQWTVWQSTLTAFDVYDVLMINNINAWASTAWGDILKYVSVSDTPPLALIKGQGAGLSDLNLYQYWSPASGDWTYWNALTRNPDPYYYARDLWEIPRGNDIVTAAAVDIDDDGTDEIAIMRNQGGDYNLYIYNALQFGETSYNSAIARNPSPLAMDLWYVPAGNNTIAMAGVKSDPIPNTKPTEYRDLLAVLKSEGGGQKLYYYNCPRSGEITWSQAFVRNGLGPYAFDEWYVPRRGNIRFMAGADGTGNGIDELLAMENAGGDYNLLVWKAPNQAGTFITELYNRVLQLGFDGFGSPQAQDLWFIPQGNDAVSITGLEADNSTGGYPGNYDALGVMRNHGGDRNFYLWRVPVLPEHTYIEAQIRQLGPQGLGTPQARDFWVIPERPYGGSTRCMVGLDY